MTIHCPVCNSSDIVEYWKNVWMDKNAVVKECRHCELLFLYPLRTEEKQKEFDKEYDNYIKEREKLVEGHTSDSFDNLVDQSIEERYNDISAYFKGVKSVLEIGAEKGGFLSLLKKDVDKLTGIDSCPPYKEKIASLGFSSYLYLGDLPKEEKFDRICFFSLLEHVLEPGPFLTTLRAHLSDDGVMIIEVPSAKDPLMSLYDLPAFKDFYFQAMHPYVYSLKALSILLEQSGLKVRDVQYKQRYGLSNHLKWIKEGRPGGDEFLEGFFSEEVKKEYIKNLEDKGNTDTIYLIVEKLI